MHDQDWPALPYEAMQSVDEYASFLASKRAGVVPSGFDVAPETINPKLFPFQRDVVRWALRLGKAALFEECGLGKTAQELEWARQVVTYTAGKVIILTPLAVAQQFIREGEKFGIQVKFCKEQRDVGDASIIVTNYERLHKFEPDKFAGVVLDESSILKNFMGKTKQAILEAFAHTPYKLCGTATPAPNDHMELGNHAEFLDVMPSSEMLMRWFINDTMKSGKYRLKEHAKADFWRWLTSWGVFLSKPGDLGLEYDMPEFVLPELVIDEHRLSANQSSIERTFAEGKLLPDTNPTATTMHKVKRESLADRVQEAVEIIKSIPADAPVIVWCDTDYESDALIAVLRSMGATEVRGSYSPEYKEACLNAFTLGEYRIIVTKPSIAGYGLNWQHCANMVFVGVSFSFENFYQSLRRSYRFGQKNPVTAHLIYAETEGNVLTTLKVKQAAFKEMQEQASVAIQEHGLFRDLQRTGLVSVEPSVAQGDNWTLYLGDCVTEIKQLKDNSVDFGIHSPPFANLYIYSDSEADMGNSADDEEFFKHYEFLIQEMYRTTRPGRLCAVHCKDLPAYMNRDGAAGLIDFPGKIIQAFERHRWQYHSRVTIWKDPVIEMERTNNHGLLHKNFATTTDACRQGMPDYLLLFRKWPLEGSEPVKQLRTPGDYIGTEPPPVSSYTNSKRTRTPEWYKGTVEQYNYSIAVWQRYASPVWFDIDQTNVLNYEIAKDERDEKHICPLQLDVIARAIDIWSNPGDTVFSPFAGVGSEGYQALLQHRKFIGIELKPSYHKQAQKNLIAAAQKAAQVDLFQFAGVAV